MWFNGFTVFEAAWEVIFISIYKVQITGAHQENSAAVVENRPHRSPVDKLGPNLVSFRF